MAKTISQSQKWARFTQYEVRDGYIRPASGSDLKLYDTWSEYWQARERDARSHQPPYLSLIELFAEVEAVPDADGSLPSPQGEEKISAWCARYGLLGILLQEVELVMLAPRMMRPNTSMSQAYEGTMLSSGEPLAVLRSYERRGASWRTVTHCARNNDVFTLTDLPWPEMDSHVPAGLESSGLIDCGPLPQRDLAPDSWPASSCVLASPWFRPGWMLKPLDQEWRRFFPDLTAEDPLPPPLSPEFWQHYAEPAGVFLDAAMSIGHVVEGLRVDRPLRPEGFDAFKRQMAANEVLHTLLSTVSPVLRRKGAPTPQQHWVAPSLLGMFAAMIAQDESEHRSARQCAVCPRLFISGAHAARYCSQRCRNRALKRRQRRKPRTRPKK